MDLSEFPTLLRNTRDKFIDADMIAQNAEARVKEIHSNFKEIKSLSSILMDTSGSIHALSAPVGEDNVDFARVCKTGDLRKQILALQRQVNVHMSSGDLAKYCTAETLQEDGGTEGVIWVPNTYVVGCVLSLYVVQLAQLLMTYILVGRLLAGEKLVHVHPERHCEVRGASPAILGLRTAHRTAR